MWDHLPTIQTLVAPIAVISADGLLCLALYNRMAAVIGRSRNINRERFELSARLSAADPSVADPPETAHIERRLHVLDELGHQLFDRVRYVRDSLVCLLVAVLLMLGCSLAIGLTAVVAWFHRIALALFVLGVLVMMLGIVKAIQELWIALSPVLFEHEMMERSFDERTGQEESGGASRGVSF